ncbi:tRNA (N6-threonylcarbamoyladenosine(37)-N6)-methyltransferase TrmO [Cellulomonas sp. McL0617]|uniref:tRNA (N6-threonylcarbamoyladenosine(37)-N6)-methyltransferase TrmO n=1 Tax=Cellulomonas sp. McL0617 TaxID=3415675 RepID=UPI003CECE964
MRYEVTQVGRVESPLYDRDQAPRQGDEGSPDAWVVVADEYADAVADVAVGEDVLLLTWFDRAARDVHVVHPRGDVTRTALGVFSTRSPDRPNPIGLHRVTVREIHGTRLLVSNLEALDGTPVLDIKPVLGAVQER